MEQGGYQTIGEMIYSETKHPSSGRVRRNRGYHYIRRADRKNLGDFWQE
jgi:hypothetical protein